MTAAAPSPDPTRQRAVELPGGRLEITIDEERLPLDELCDFAARNNGKRGFLIVSRVLGRHMPTAPAAMQRSFDAIAELMAHDEAGLPGPVVFMGMAETAICLGQGVHAAYRAQSGRTDTLYIHSTRQVIDAEVMATFEEPHSHASAHLIYRPASEAHRTLLAEARSLVLVDDEVSTGTTFTNLATALTPLMPNLAGITTVVLADWSGGSPYLARMPLPATSVSLFRGALAWRAAPGAVAPPAAVRTDKAGALGRLDTPDNFGRLGIQGDPGGIDELIPADLRTGPPCKVLVLGTGEFTYPPFLLARALERLGHSVAVQSTTRSPVQVGGAIGCALTFADNYETDVPNFVYNVAHEPGRRVLICHETPANSVDPALVRTLEAQCIQFGGAR